MLFVKTNDTLYNAATPALLYNATTPVLLILIHVYAAAPVLLYVAANPGVQSGNVGATTIVASSSKNSSKIGLAAMWALVPLRHALGPDLIRSLGNDVPQLLACNNNHRLFLFWTCIMRVAGP